MRKDVEKQFEDLAQQTVADAEGVICSFPEFVEGLKMLLDAVQGRYDLACEENRGKDG